MIKVGYKNSAHSLIIKGVQICNIFIILVVLLK